MDLSNIIHYIVRTYSDENKLASITENRKLTPIKLNKILWFATRETIIETGNRKLIPIKLSKFLWFANREAIIETGNRKLTPIKLNKILWFADREAIIETGKSITGLTYIKKPYGPAIKNIDNIISELVTQELIQTAERIDRHKGRHLDLSSDKELNISTIPENFIKFLDKSIDDSLKYRTDEYSEKSHDATWEMVDFYHEIPRHYIYFSHTAEVPEESVREIRDAINNGEIQLQEFSKRDAIQNGDMQLQEFTK